MFPFGNVRTLAGPNLQDLTQPLVSICRSGKIKPATEACRCRHRYFRHRRKHGRKDSFWGLCDQGRAFFLTLIHSFKLSPDIFHRTIPVPSSYFDSWRHTVGRGNDGPGKPVPNLESGISGSPHASRVCHRFVKLFAYNARQE